MVRAVLVPGIALSLAAFTCRAKPVAALNTRGSAQHSRHDVWRPRKPNVMTGGSPSQNPAPLQRIRGSRFTSSRLSAPFQSDLWPSISEWVHGVLSAPIADRFDSCDRKAARR